jgi:hypothetical protein
MSKNTYSVIINEFSGVQPMAVITKVRQCAPFSASSIAFSLSVASSANSTMQGLSLRASSCTGVHEIPYFMESKDLNPFL